MDCVAGYWPAQDCHEASREQNLGRQKDSEDNFNICIEATDGELNNAREIERSSQSEKPYLMKPKSNAHPGSLLRINRVTRNSSPTSVPKRRHSIARLRLCPSYPKSEPRPTSRRQGSRCRTEGAETNPHPTSLSCKHVSDFIKDSRHSTEEDLLGTC